MSPLGLKFSQMILHTETSKLMYNWSFLFVVLHKATLLPSTFKILGLQIGREGPSTFKIVGHCYVQTCLYSMHAYTILQTDANAWQVSQLDVGQESKVWRKKNCI